LSTHHKVDQSSDGLVSLDGMSKWEIGSHDIAVPPTVADPLDVPGFFKLRYDSLDRSLCDPNVNGDIAHPRLRVPGKTQKNMGVVGEKGPRHLWFW
jgi:hypothetical protein